MKICCQILNHHYSFSSTTIAIYDTVLNIRLQSWFSLLREQAGAQKYRGCQEQFITLRLLMDMAMSWKQKLFLVFIHSSKAYDLVPGDKLLTILKNLGRGFTMIVAIATVYWSTTSILRAALITATIGVRRGFPTSCILFVIYLNGFVNQLGHSVTMMAI